MSVETTVEFHGKNFVGSALSATGSKTFHGYDPKQGRRLDTPFYEATPDEIDRAAHLAADAAPVLRRLDGDAVAALLNGIAEEILALGDALIDQAALESGLGKDRLTGERARTVNQLRLFADLAKDGSFVDARIDTALPDRKPLPRPDLRRMLMPVGPVAVFAASNFPLAFSVAGGDTASALASRNPVVLKAHPAHPGTSELVAGAVRKAVSKNNLPEGTFSMLHATDPALAIALVQHPAIQAVGFTGSERAGRAIYNAAAERPDPIPAFVEMGSINPVFILPGALKTSPDTLAQGLAGSVNLGVGQFCTCPGVVAGEDTEAFNLFREKLAAAFSQTAPGSMLYPGILKGYQENVRRAEHVTGVRAVKTTLQADVSKTEATPELLETDAITWLANEELQTEIFGPSTTIVRSDSRDRLLEVAEALPGTLTATVHGTPEDLEAYRDLIAILETKAGRIIFNGFPTGVEVSHAMHHGGPYPATADAKFTSVGTAAVYRFLRPVCYQNFPESQLPAELRNSNPRQIWRMVNGSLTRDAIA